MRTAKTIILLDYKMAFILLSSPIELGYWTHPVINGKREDSMLSGDLYAIFDRANRVVAGNVRFKNIQRLWIPFLLLAIFNALSEHGSAEIELSPLPEGNNCKVMVIFAHIYRLSPLSGRENAAWIVRDSENELVPLYWPRIPQEAKQFWDDALPKNIVALVHNHPEFVDPKPSKQDMEEAHRLNIYIFTLSRKGIWSVSPDKVIRKHAGVGWLKNVQEKCGDDTVLNLQKELGELMLQIMIKRNTPLLLELLTAAPTQNEIQAQ